MALEQIVSLDVLLPLVAELKEAGKIIVTTNGCFDLLHAGHVQNLEWAKAQGDILIVGINSDASVGRLKGPKRPIVPERERALVIAALKPVDYVFIFGEDTPLAWLSEMKPAVHVKGGMSGTTPAFLPEEETVIEGGGQVRLAPHVDGLSTTNSIEKIRASYREDSESERS